MSTNNNHQFLGEENNDQTTPSGSAEKDIPGSWPLIKQSWRIFKANWKSFLKPYLFILIPFIVMLIILVVYAVLGMTMAKTDGHVPPVVNIILGAIGVIDLIAIIYFSVLMTLSYYFLLKHLENNEQVSAKQLLKESAKSFWPYLAIMILFGLIVLGGYILLIVPGIIFCIWFEFIAFIFVFEGKRGWAAFKGSKELVKNYWWTVFARLLIFQIFMLLINIPNYIFQGIVNYSAGMNIWLILLLIILFVYCVFVGLIVFPLGFIYRYYIYHHLKQVKEKDPAAKTSMGLGKKFGLIILAIILVIIMFALSFLLSGWQKNGLNSLAAAQSRDAARIEDRFKVLATLEQYYLSNQAYPTSLSDLTSLSTEDLSDPLFDIGYQYKITDDQQNFSLCQIFEQKANQADQVIVCVDKTGEEQIVSPEAFLD